MKTSLTVFAVKAHSPFGGRHLHGLFRTPQLAEVEAARLRLTVDEDRWIYIVEEMPVMSE